MRGTARRLCFACGNAVEADEQFVLARGRERVPHCSEGCVRATLGVRRARRWRSRLRVTAGATLVALVAVGVWSIKRHRAQKPRSIALSWTETAWEKSVPQAPTNFFGPAWPPTDADWAFAFDRAAWTYPLPGPVRRPPVANDRLFVTDAKPRPAACRAPNVCGVSLGGQLWGEHVFAVLEGVVDRSVPGGGDDHGGGYVRIAHFGGMVFTHYFHLAAIPRGVVRGARVSAGEVIGLVGDTGTGGEGSGARPHLHFAFSIRPSAEWPEAYWDPTPLMAKWALRVPPHGSVAGLLAATDAMEIPRRHKGH